jgi:NAD(P)-dependent dehydrogenase (short-subunit alcohol dehydrogenase family)
VTPQAATTWSQEIKAMGGKAQAFQADVGIEADILRLFTEVDQRDGPHHGLVNNAGVVDVACSRGRHVMGPSWNA